MIQTRQEKFFSSFCDLKTNYNCYQRVFISNQVIKWIWFFIFWSKMHLVTEMNCNIDTRMTCILTPRVSGPSRPPPWRTWGRPPCPCRRHCSCTSGDWCSHIDKLSPTGCTNGAGAAVLQQTMTSPLALTSSGASYFVPHRSRSRWDSVTIWWYVQCHGHVT